MAVDVSELDLLSVRRLRGIVTGDDAPHGEADLPDVGPGVVPPGHVGWRPFVRVWGDGIPGVTVPFLVILLRQAPAQLSLRSVLPPQVCAGVELLNATRLAKFVNLMRREPGCQRYITKQIVERDKSYLEDGHGGVVAVVEVTDHDVIWIDSEVYPT